MSAPIWSSSVRRASKELPGCCWDRWPKAWCAPLPARCCLPAADSSRLGAHRASVRRLSRGSTNHEPCLAMVRAPFPTPSSGAHLSRDAPILRHGIADLSLVARAACRPACACWGSPSSAAPASTLLRAKRDISGEGGIRTLGTLAGTHDFQSCTFGHSVTSPEARIDTAKIAQQQVDAQRAKGAN
jgi:hypothetical protein